MTEMNSVVHLKGKSLQLLQQCLARTFAFHCQICWLLPSVELFSQGFKWFGSLTNLSFRRSSEKPDSKASRSKHGVRSGSVPVVDSQGVIAGSLSSPAETTLDDLEAIRPRTSSYVRSSEDYTHMGTLPRLLMRKRDKSNKGKSSRSSMISTYEELVLK